MSLDKAIEHRKEKRKQYYGAKAIHCSCRNHGSCSYCLSNRMYQQNKEDNKMKEKLNEYLQV